MKPDSPCLLPQQPAQTAGERGLTHAVGPGDSHYLTRPDGKGQLTEHRLSFLKGAGQPLHREAFPGPGPGFAGGRVQGADDSVRRPSLSRSSSVSR